MKTELRGGPKDGDIVEAPPPRVARLIDFPDMGAHGAHRYEIVGVHGIQHTDGTSEFRQWAKYVGYFASPSP